MANPPKQKGTGGEREVRREFEARDFVVERTAPGESYDLRVLGVDPIDVLATRPDKGRWLATVDLRDLIDLLEHADIGAHVEVKRYARFALHTIFEGKFA